MDTSTLVDDRIGNGRRFVERFAVDGHPVSGAFWVRTTDDALWYLYVVTEMVDRLGPMETYRAVGATVQTLEKPRISSFEIKVIGPNHPVFREVSEILRHWPNRTVARFEGERLATTDADLVCVYPSHYFSTTAPEAMTSDEIGREILRRMSDGPGKLLPAKVALKSGESFDGVPNSLQLGSRSELVARFVVERETAPREIPLDEISAVL